MAFVVVVVDSAKMLWQSICILGSRNNLCESHVHCAQQQQQWGFPRHSRCCVYCSSSISH
eukprot:4201-Heterococcus_DN1.PRE.4